MIRDSISFLKVNVIVSLLFDLAPYDVTVQYFGHYATAFISIDRFEQI